MFHRSGLFNNSTVPKRDIWLNSEPTSYHNFTQINTRFPANTKTNTRQPIKRKYHSDLKIWAPRPIVWDVFSLAKNQHLVGGNPIILFLTIFPLKLPSSFDGYTLRLEWISAEDVLDFCRTVAIHIFHALAYRMPGKCWFCKVRFHHSCTGEQVSKSKSNINRLESKFQIANQL